MASQILLPPRIETLTPQMHSFVRAYVWQLDRGVEPVLQEDALHHTAISVARAIIEIHSDRVLRRQLIAELGEYLRDSEHTLVPSAALQRLLANFNPPMPSADAPAAPAALDTSQAAELSRYPAEKQAEEPAKSDELTPPHD